MIRPLKTDTRTKRSRELRSILGTRKSARKQRFPWLAKARAYVVAHYKMLLCATVIIALVYTHIYYFNKLTTMRQQVANLRGQVRSGLQMRENTIRSQTIALNRFIAYEKNVMLTAVEARKDTMSMSEDLEKLEQVVQQLSNKDLSPESLSRLIAVAENYPQLASTQVYKVFITQIGQIEGQIYEKRIEYNNAANGYNTSCSTFPANVVGAVLGFQREPYFTWDKGPEWVFVTDEKSGQPPLKMTSEEKDMQR